jgi:hypothetical protein
MLNNADRHLERVIRRMILLAELNVQNYMTRYEEVVRTVRRMRPDMTASEALAKVDQARYRSVDIIRQVDQP